MMDNMEHQLIAIADIAHLHGRRRQSVHKIVNRLGIKTVMKKSDGARGQKISYITVHEYEEVKRLLDRSYSPYREPMSGEPGVFYIVQLEPQYDPGRFKVGFTTDIVERLRNHRTSAPFCEIYRTWPCKLLWEKTAIDCVSQGCEQLYTEVFRTSDISGVANNAELFFALMPPLGTINGQSETSHQVIKI